MPNDLCGDQIIDSRDVIARIEELEGERDAFTEPPGNGEPAASPELWAEEYPDDAAELAALLALQEEGERCAGDWEHGAILIRDSYFEEYAQQLAEDIGAIPRDLAWPACHIDWEAAADALRMDYTSVEYDGVTYWVRS